MYSVYDKISKKVCHVSNVNLKKYAVKELLKLLSADLGGSVSDNSSAISNCGYLILRHKKYIPSETMIELKIITDIYKAEIVNNQ